MKLLPMNLTPRFVAGLLMAFFGMIFLWILSPHLLGEKEFWDVPAPTQFFLFKVLGVTAGFVAGGRHWVCPVLVTLAALAGQSLYVVVNGVGPLLLVGLIMQVFMVLPIFIPTLVGFGLALLVSEILKRVRPTNPTA